MEKYRDCENEIWDQFQLERIYYINLYDLLSISIDIQSDNQV